MPKNTYTSGNPYVKAFNDALGTFQDFATFLADPGERQNIRQGAMDAINRGAVAGALGAPVDITNAALNLGKAAVGYLGNKAGVLSADQMPQLIDNPVGGSEYIGNQMRRFGMVSPNRNALAEGIAGFLPISPSASGRAVAALAGGGVVPGMDLAATVWHGSPHKFDKFDSSKIGTGEGAQAYGHGLYLADAPGVATQYKQAGNFDMPDLVTKSGRMLRVPRWSADLPPEDRAVRALADAITVARSKGLDEAAAITKAGGNLTGPARIAFDRLKTEVSGVNEIGNLYKVDLPDSAISRMLDWDKPLSQQAPEVQAALEKAGIGVDKQSLRAFDDALLDALSGGSTNLPKQPADFAGEVVYKKLGGKEMAAEKLRSLGIPGIRYLDGGSRGAGSGTSNYVVFPGNENMLRILERNGQALK